MHLPTHINILTYSLHDWFFLNTCRGNIIDLSLSGQRALEFDAEAVFDIGQNHHVIAIFVGTLMKNISRRLQISQWNFSMSLVYK
jgi:replication factor A1